MKTNNYQFDLMHQGQDHKDIVYNETILKLDANLNFSVIEFVSNPPESIAYGERFIINSGENKNKICYFAHKTKGIQYILPYDNMVVYIIKDNCFARFLDNNWQKIGSTSAGETSSAISNFTSIKDEFILPNIDNCHYLYLQGNCKISFANVDKVLFAIIIKQNYSNSFEIEWPWNILWSNKESKQITSKHNSIDFFKFHKIPESSHYLVESAQQNYQY